MPIPSPLPSRPMLVLLPTLAMLFCAGVLTLDIATTSDVTEAFLYSLAFVIIYPVRRDWAIALVLAVSILFTLLGGIWEDEGDSGAAGLINRAMAVIVMTGVGALMWRASAAERTLFRLSVADTLTGVWNRRYFLQQLEREQKRAERYATSFSVLVLDIDRFKSINDGWGHQVGDEAIRAMAQVCQRFLRPTDMLCRYGGEEFVIALPHTDEAGAVIAAERIREAVEALRVPAGDGVLQLTVSIGVACFVKKSPLQAVIDCADQALYAAKRGGRNQVQIGRLAPASA